jgi:L-alanine-DL-glutamate epimerase-like enolase superfamily enzyme
MWIPNPLAEIFTTPLPQPVNGELQPPERPGLGLALDRKKLEKFKLS